MKFVDMYPLLLKNKTIILCLEESHESYLSARGIFIIKVI